MNKLEIVPHPVFNSENYLNWSSFHYPKIDRKKEVPEQKIFEGTYAEAFQSELVFSHKQSSSPVIASYGAGPCVILGAYHDGMGFIVHFSHQQEVIISSEIIFSLFKKMISSKKGKTIELHIRGGITEDPISIKTTKSLQNLIRTAKELLPPKKLKVISSKNLISKASDSESLLIDTRSGNIGSYDPLLENPKNYRKLSMGDIIFARDSFEKKAQIRVLCAF